MEPIVQDGQGPLLAVTVFLGSVIVPILVALIGRMRSKGPDMEEFISLDAFHGLLEQIARSDEITHQITRENARLRQENERLVRDNARLEFHRRENSQERRKQDP